MARSKKFANGRFEPVNTAKYKGKTPITYRSSWELVFMKVLDNHPNVVAWSSESITIPYMNPLTGKQTLYVPDFLIAYIDKKGKHICELVEIKPLKEVPNAGGPRVSQKTKLIQAVNMAKWAAAQAFCKRRGWTFRVMTERDLFGETEENKAKRKRK